VLHQQPSKMRILFISFVAICVTCTSFSQTYKNKYTLVITNANIVDVINNKIESDRLLAISGDTIEAIDDASKVKNYKADRYVNATNKYIIPGLWDMHIHLRGGDSLIYPNKKLLPLFLANGVTTVRECGGDITASVMLWKKQIEQGKLAGPKIFTSGPKIDGPKATWAGSLEVETPEQVSAALDSLQKLQVDFVKVYDSKISREAYLETIAQAHKRGMKITGHMPFTVESREGVNLGLDASEHMYYVFKACSAKEDSITQVIRLREHTDNPVSLFAALTALYDTYEDTKARQLFTFLAQKEFTVVPTLIVTKTLRELKQNNHFNDSMLAYIDPKIQETYQLRISTAKKQSEESSQFMKRYMQKTNAMVPQMYAAGVNILAGSDCGAFNSFVYPGSSLHEEIKLMVASGLTPAEALQTATINGAKFMGVANFYGSIQKGKSSDMVVFDANPLTDINTIDQISMVLSHGKLYSRGDLDNLLLSIKH
jgi:imidazolonepropionase-like amidohydrolase